MKLLKGLLVASLVTSLSLFTGCSDDEEDGKRAKRRRRDRTHRKDGELTRDEA